MKYLKGILATMAFVFAIGAAFATYNDNNVPVVFTDAYPSGAGCSGTAYTITVPTDESRCGFSGSNNCKIAPLGTDVDAFQNNSTPQCVVLTYN